MLFGLKSSFLILSMNNSEPLFKLYLRPRVDIFVSWEHGIAYLPLFLGYFNSMDKTGNINFTMEIASDIG